MKRKFSKILGLGLTLALLASMLVMAVPVAATGPIGLPFFTIAAGGTAQWSTDHPISGSYSAKLGLPISSTSEARVVFNYDGNLTSIAGVSYQSYVEGGEDGQLFPIVVLAMDTDDDPEVDTWVVGSGLTSAGGFVYPKLKDDWREIVFDDDFPVHVAGARPGLESDHYLAYGNANSDDDTLGALKAETGWGEFTVVEVKVMIGEFSLTEVMTAYVDDIEINGDSYDLEPSFLDADWYKTDDTVAISVQDHNFNLDAVRPDEMTVHAVSTTDTVGIDVVLEETDDSSSVFTGSFPTTGISPGADELKVSDADTITVTYYYLDGDGNPITGNPISNMATVDDAAPTIDDVLDVGTAPVVHITTTPEIIFDSSPDIVATVTDDSGSGINEASIEMTVNGDVVATDFDAGSVTYTVDPALDPGTVVDVTVDVSDNMGNAAETASWSFSIASALNATVDPTEWTAGNVGTLTVNISDVEGYGVMDNPEDPAANELAWVKVVVSAPVGQTLSTGEWTGLDGVYGDATGSASGTILTFTGLLPNDASSDITVTVTGELVLEGTPVGPVPLTIPVSGFIVTDITPSTFQIIHTTSDISVMVTTKAGEAVSASLVTITAEEVGGFQKDVAGDEELESFQTITINGLTSEIKYDDGDAETCSITGGLYQVTGIKFAELGGVAIEVGQDASTQALFDPAFSVRGVKVYEILLDPDTVTAGIETEVAVTVTEDGNPVTAIDSIELDSTVLLSADTSETGEYTITMPATPEAGTPAVTVTGEGGQKYGTVDSTIGLPAVDYTIYETVDEEEVARNVMLTGVTTYTLDVTVAALGQPLDCNLWIGTYDAEEEEFTSEAGPATVTDGVVEGFAVTAPSEACSLVWMVGSSATLDETQALLLTPFVTVEEFCYSLNPTEATVGEDTTYTVTDNYGNPAADRDVKIVTPSIETHFETTGPADTTLAGKFIYTAAEAGDYFVSVKLDDASWQAPITVTVSEVAPTYYILTTAAVPEIGGTATDVTNASPYAEGDSVSIKAVVEDGYRFVDWTASAGTFMDADDAETTFTMPGEAVTVTANFELIGPKIATISLVSGYNLISLPLIPDEPAINTMTASLDDLVRIYRYDALAETPDWFAYNPAMPFPEGSSLLTMDDGWGYWVKMEDPGTGGSFTFSGSELVAGPEELPPSYDVVEGWNLIGFKSTATSGIAAYLGGVSETVDAIYGYQDGTFFIPTELEPGFGYWIAVTEPGTIYP